jgi:hypothetical protein
VNTTVTCVYRIAQGGAALTTLQSKVAAVVVNSSILSTLGARITSDVTTIAAGFAIRTIVFSIVPTVAAGATAALNSNDFLSGVSVFSAGSDYILPPVVKFAGGNPYKIASARATLKAVGVNVVAGGSGYTAAAVATAVGAINPNHDIKLGQAPPKPVLMTLTLGGGGAIVGVAITDAGANYEGVPSVVVTDVVGGGSGAIIDLSMGVSAVDVIYPGQGFQAVPACQLIPAFRVMFPDGPSQAAPFANLMTTAIAQAVMTPVVADAPVLS